MLVLNAGDKIRGYADGTAVVDYTIYGMDGDELSLMAEGQLSNTHEDLFTADSIDIIKQVVMVNTDTSNRTVNLYVLPSAGGIARWVSPKDLRINAGFAAYFNGTGVTLSGPTTASGSVLAETRGGTGQSTFSAGDIMYASADDTLEKLSSGDEGQVLTMGASIPAWAAAAGGSGAMNLADDQPDTVTAGDLWFEDGVLKLGTGATDPVSSPEVWTTGTATNHPGAFASCAGTQLSMLTYGSQIYGSAQGDTGGDGALSAQSELWDSLSWSDASTVPGAAYGGMGGGTANAAWYAGGTENRSTAFIRDMTYTWDGTSWTQQGDLPDHCVWGGGCGTTSASLIMGGVNNYSGGVYGYNGVFDDWDWRNSTAPMLGDGTSWSYFGTTYAAAGVTTLDWNSAVGDPYYGDPDEGWWPFGDCFGTQSSAVLTGGVSNSDEGPGFGITWLFDGSSIQYGPHVLYTHASPGVAGVMSDGLVWGGMYNNGEMGWGWEVNAKTERFDGSAWSYTADHLSGSRIQFGSGGTASAAKGVGGMNTGYGGAVQRYAAGLTTVYDWSADYPAYPIIETVDTTEV